MSGYWVAEETKKKQENGSLEKKKGKKLNYSLGKNRFVGGWGGKERR